MISGWLTDAFLVFIKSLFPFAGSFDNFTPDEGWGHTLLGVWLPAVGDSTDAGALSNVWFVTIGIGVALALWYAIPALITATSTGDIRAIVQALLGIGLAGVSGAAALTVVNLLRDDVITTGQNLAGDAATQLMVNSMQDGNVLGVLAIVLASITYLVAGLIGGYAFVLVTVLAPIATASLVFKGGIQSFLKWLSWFFTLLLAPVWVGIAFAVTAAVSGSTDAFALEQISAAVGVVIAAAAPFTMLAVIGKLIPHGGGADNATKVGAGNTVGSAMAYSAPRMIK